MGRRRHGCYCSSQWLRTGVKWRYAVNGCEGRAVLGRQRCVCATTRPLDFYFFYFFCALSYPIWGSCTRREQSMGLDQHTAVCKAACAWVVYWTASGKRAACGLQLNTGDGSQSGQNATSGQAGLGSADAVGARSERGRAQEEKRAGLGGAGQAGRQAVSESGSQVACSPARLLVCAGGCDVDKETVRRPRWVAMVERRPSQLARLLCW